MKTIKMEYVEYKEDLLAERMKMIHIFEPLLKTVHWHHDVFVGKSTTEPPLSHKDMLNRIFDVAFEVKQNFLLRNKI
jgi:hypothetical protein